MWTIKELDLVSQMGVNGQIFMGLYLGILTFLDLVYQKIPVWLLGGGGIIVSAIWIDQCPFQAIVIITRASVGIIFLVISCVTRQAFGYADSILIFILGICLGFWNLIIVLSYAFGLSAVYSMILMATTCATRKMTYPFIPFLTIAYVGVLIF